MKKSNAFLLALFTFMLGYVAGLMWAAYKGPPPMPRQQHAEAPAAPQANKAGASQDGQELQTRITALKEKIKAKPDDLGLYVEAGDLLFEHEMFQDAAGYYEQAVELGLPDPDVFNDLAICYRRLGDPKKAVEYFRRARTIDPQHQNSALNMGIVYFHDLQDNQEAIKVWKEYLALNPEGERAEMIRRVVAQLEQGQNPAR